MSKNLKILIANNDLEMGGIQKSLIEFLHYLDNAGKYDTDLVLWQEDGPLQKDLPKGTNVIFQKYPKNVSQILSQRKKSFQQIFQILQYIYYQKILKKPWLYYKPLKKTYDVAVSFTHSGMVKFFVSDCVKAKKKIMWYHHGAYNSYGKQKNIDGKYFAKFDKIVAVAEDNKNMLRSYFSHLKNLTVIPNIINVEKIRHLSKEKIDDFPGGNNFFNLVTVTRFSPEKGLDLAMQTANSLKIRNFKFKWYFVGSGENFDHTKTMAREMHLEENCIFLGQKTNPYPYISQADVYVQTSYVEADPITINEALVLKKPIVATNLPSIADVLKNSENSRLSSPEPETFARHISQISELNKNLPPEKDNFIDERNRFLFERLDQLLSV